MSFVFSISKILRILLIVLHRPIFGDETSFSSSDQHFRHIEAVKPQVSYILYTDGLEHAKEMRSIQKEHKIPRFENSFN